MCSVVETLPQKILFLNPNLLTDINDLILVVGGEKKCSDFT